MRGSLTISSVVIGIIQTPFFLLFCITSAFGATLAHRLFVRALPPTLAERVLAVACALLSLALSALTYAMRVGAYAPAHIDPGAAAIVATFTGLGVAFVCLRCVLGEDAAE